MSVVVDVSIPPDSFTQGRSLAAEPAMTVEAERLASHSTEEVMPFLWASGGDFDAFRAAMGADPAVAEANVAETGDDSELYHVIWHDEFLELIDEMIDQHASILEARGNVDAWRVTLRFPEEGDVSAFHDHFEDRGRRFEVERIFRPTFTRPREYGLTSQQRDALVATEEVGYFQVPWSISAEDLADALDISSNAAS